MNKKSKIMIISLIIAIFFEICIFNSQELCTLFAKQKNVEVDYSIKFLQSENPDYSHLKIEDNIEELIEGSSKINIKDLNFEVHNIRIYYEEDYKINVKYCSSANVYGYSEISLSYGDKIMMANKNNTYIKLKTEDLAENIDIEVHNYDEEATALKIDKIVLNSTQLNIKYIRIIIVFIIMTFLIYIKKWNLHKEKYNSNSKKQKYYYYGIIIFFMIVLLFYYKTVLFTEPDDIFCKYNNGELLHVQADSFLKGQLELLEEPNDELKNLSNPYDYSLRKNIEYRWDTSYYNENYYQYFTVLPIIFFVIPIKLLTGYYITTAAINIIVLMVTLFLIAKLVKKLVDRYIKEITVFNLLLAEITVIIASDVILLSRGWLYEVAELLGIINLILTILIIFSIEKDSKISNRKLIWVGITTAFIVISKPSFIMWYLLIFPMMFKVLYEKNNKKINKQLINKIFIYAIPIAVIALIQMAYNYARFDNIFEFGARYQLTIYDMNVLMSFSIPRLIKGVIIYLFKSPTINLDDFPFISIIDECDITTTLGVIAFEFCNLGLLAVPIFWGLFVKNEVLKDVTQKEKELKKAINIIIVVSSIIMIVNILFAGICEQYAIQYKVMLIMSTILILIKGIEKNKISNRVFFILCIVSILITLPISLNTLDYFLDVPDTNLDIFLENMFEFWK